MKKCVLALAMILGLTLVGSGASHAQAASPFGLHIGGRGVHIDIGNVHRGYRHRGHYDWYGASHYDWHPGYYRVHGNHLHYAPGHYDLHHGDHYGHSRRGHGHRRHGCYY